MVTKSNNLVKRKCVSVKILKEEIFRIGDNERENCTFINNNIVINTVVFLSK